MVKNIALFWWLSSCKSATYILLVAWTLSACGGGEASTTSWLGSEKTTPSGVKYIFFQQNSKNKKAQSGDLITFHLIIQNHQDSIIRNTYREGKTGIQELPFESDFFIGKEYFKDIFAQVAEGDSLAFWIRVDSLVNKSGFLKTAKTPSGTQVKYTVKVLKIRSKAEIKQELEKNLQAQRRADSLLISKYLDSLVKKQKNLQILQTASGLRYYFTQTGAGKSPIEGDTISVNYVGKFLDGTIYNSSDANTEFVLGNTLPLGLDEGLALLQEGSKATFFLPSELGFGAEGMGNLVPPHAILIFEVELVKIR
ncbi:MAG: FKBP-type peptidyl-prolyl cis-trans isomerase [Microscillaceae bacterium]|jgi:FKBP-type peptidyl-prolyl cis-trans isomerase|nr:FKBP-type peptidyl-prolyl cis-trans isomerase [Microscillaceae bacterium]